MRKAAIPLLVTILGILLGCSGEVETTPPPPPEPAQEAPQEVDLFNGTSLDGWAAFLVEPDVPMEDVWSVQDGLLVCKGEPMGYLHTTDDYMSYKLIVEWRWAPGTEPGNSGVLLRINGEPQALPRAIEAQLKSGDAGNLYGFHGMKLDGDPERTTKQSNGERVGDLVAITKIDGNENEPGQWNTYEITLDGSDLTVVVNGKELNKAWDCEMTRGPIGLQSEGGEIHFRKVVLTPLGG